MGWVKDNRFGIVEEIIDRVGGDKAPTELTRLKICVSRAEARRLVRCIKIQRKDQDGKESSV